MGMFSSEAGSCAATSGFGAGAGRLSRIGGAHETSTVSASAAIRGRCSSRRIVSLTAGDSPTEFRALKYTVFSPSPSVSKYDREAAYVCHVAPAKSGDSDAMYCVGFLVHVLVSVTAR
jgi:hypothetical protein